MSRPSAIDKEAAKILRRWCRCAYYVYIRPLDYRFFNPSGDFAIHWRVTVEYRGTDYKQHIGEGMNLSEVIHKLGAEVPLRKPKTTPRAEIPKPTTIQRVVIKKPQSKTKRKIMPPKKKKIKRD